MNQSEPVGIAPRLLWSRCLRFLAFAAIFILPLHGVIVCDDEVPARVVPDLSRETTSILEPVTEDGFVDYIGAVNQRASKGVSPEENFELIVRSVMGNDAIAGYEEEYCRLLGVDSLTPTTPHFVSYDIFLNGGDPAQRPSSSDVFNNHDYSSALGRIWTAEEYPKLSQWIESNKSVLDELVRGSSRKRDYTPYLVNHGIDETRASLVNVILPWSEERRLLSSALVVRATSKGGGREHESAWDDLRAVHRIARLTSQHLSTEVRLAGYAYEAMAIRGDIVLLSVPNLDADTLLARGNELRKLETLPTMKDALDTYSRWRCLDFLLTSYFFPASLIDPKKKAARAKNVAALLSKKELDKALRWTNEQFDRQVRIFEIENIPDRKRMSEAYLEEIEEMLISRKENVTIRSLLSTKASWHAETMRNLAYAETAPDPFILSVSQTIQETLRRMAYTAYFVMEYQRRHGEFPADLNQLVPGRFERVPEDLCMRKPLYYTRLPGGFLLHSYGVNQTDDAKIDVQAAEIPESIRDDIVIIFLNGQARLVR